ncbi:MAG: YbjN domain-containing protein [Chitinophagaceae bacterium]
MSTIEFARAYISRLCRDIGTTADAIYNEKTSAWYFTRGSSTIEVFLTTIETGSNIKRTFIRCIAPIMDIPGDEKKKLSIFQKALELNNRHMGIKLCSNTEMGLLCAVTERDIEGMDYDEFINLITDIGFWADHLDDSFK